MRRRKRKTPEQRRGDYFTRVCRATKLEVSVARPEAAGLDYDEGINWWTICEPHSTLVGSSSRYLAERAATFPDFCEECQKILFAECPTCGGKMHQCKTGDPGCLHCNDEKCSGELRVPIATED